MNEVMITGNELWTNGQRAAVRDAVLAFCECAPEVVDRYVAQGFGNSDASALLAAFCGEEYVGYGIDAHQDADQFVFASATVAQAFANALWDGVARLGLTVGVAQLEQYGGATHKRGGTNHA